LLKTSTRALLNSARSPRIVSTPFRPLRRLTSIGTNATSSRPARTIIAI